MCSKIHTCAFHRQGRNNRSQMDLFNRKVLPNLQRSLWTSRTSGHSLRRYIVTTLACYRLLDQKRSCEKFFKWTSLRLLVMILRRLILCSSIRLVSSLQFGCSFARAPGRSFHVSSIRLLILFLHPVFGAGLWDNLCWCHLRNEEKAQMIRIKFIGDS